MQRFDKLIDWTTAQADCLSKNSTFLVINSQAEYTLVSFFIKNNEKLKCSDIFD